MPVNILESFKKAQAGYPDDLKEEDEKMMEGRPWPPSDKEADEMEKKTKPVADSDDDFAKIEHDVNQMIENRRKEKNREEGVKALEDSPDWSNPSQFKLSQSGNMDENIINKSTSQLMAERYAQGVPTGAYIKSMSIQKASQPLTNYSNQNDILKEASQENTKDPVTLANASIEAIQDKYDALNYDAGMDQYNQNKVKDGRNPIMAGNSIGAVRPRQNDVETSMTEYTPEGLKNRALDVKSKMLASESPMSKKYSQDTYDQFESLMKKYGIKISPESYDAFIDDIVEAQSTGLNHLMNDAFLRKN